MSKTNPKEFHTATPVNGNAHPFLSTSIHELKLVYLSSKLWQAVPDGSLGMCWSSCEEAWWFKPLSTIIMLLLLNPVNVNLVGWWLTLVMLLGSNLSMLTLMSKPTTGWFHFLCLTQVYLYSLLDHHYYVAASIKPDNVPVNVVFR